jgi:polysaccharide pyruvyl transferase WcaK-like protein
MMDAVLEAWVSSIIEAKKFSWMLGAGEAWKPGEKLKVLFAGYNGTRNTGSDVRVEEIIRQIRRILGDQNLALSVMSFNFDRTRGYFGDARQVYLPDVFPPFLAKEVPRHDGVVACEGSMFKSKFTNALSAMMIGTLGIASAQNKLSVAYGAEAGAMDPLLQKMVRRYCQDSNETLRAAGWDGVTPILSICPINPYFWPVTPSLLKSFARVTTGAYKSSHYRGPYFHHSGADVDAAYDKYLNAIAGAVRRYRQTKSVFPILVGMEMLDANACERLSARLDGLPVFSSGSYDMYQLVSILRLSHRMISSRFHAIVTSMPAGVVSAGITMDERIRNTMRERGHDHLVLAVDDPDLEERLLSILATLDRDADAIRDSIGRVVVKNLQLMARMGTYFEDRLARRYPEFPIRTGVLSWEDYLPPLSPNLRKLFAAYS